MVVLPRPHCIAVDFDFTASHFVGEGISSVTRLFTGRGIALDIATQAWHNAEDRGFCLRTYMEEIHKLTGRSFDPEPLKYDLRVWLSQVVRPYQDTEKAFANWKALNLPVVFLSFGNEAYQYAKIDSSCLPKNKVVIVSSKPHKVAEAELLVKEFGAPIWLIEDDVKVLDLVHEVGLSPSVISIRVNRPDSPYRDVSARYSHANVASLAELSFNKEVA